MAGEAEKLSLQDLALRAYNMGAPITPMQREYNPAEAFLISAGAASESAVDQAMKAYYFGRGTFADKWQTPEEAAKHRAMMDTISARMNDNAELYEPLRQAYPYTTRAGETVPAFTAGLGPGAFALRSNMALQYLQEAANSIADAGGPISLRALAQQLRRY